MYASGEIMNSFVNDTHHLFSTRSYGRGRSLITPSNIHAVGKSIAPASKVLCFRATRVAYYLPLEGKE